MYLSLSVNLVLVGVLPRLVTKSRGVTSDLDSFAQLKVFLEVTRLVSVLRVHITVANAASDSETFKPSLLDFPDQHTELLFCTLAHHDFRAIKHLPFLKSEANFCHIGVHNYFGS